ncbi:GyrI-like domain-containing protein (plasmid) [Niallia taxi]|uniref:GyrI-like domain-containing protein n=1 Tax=Niallia taxi TaxID=2499688 RepID=UPI0023A984A1|nr:GyrI-like domain-containing protein [Niallia taxi]MDE5054301.1 GyrI-like domain-containing protein [Niallia taxi]WOD65089.1 GyrI-like domain-containing protein [Niallia taxi]
MKHEWRKHEKSLYLPKATPDLVEVPAQKFFMIDGQGNPNGEEFAERVKVLYSMAYAVRMMPKGGVTPPGYVEYTVYPLEGIWSLTEKGRKLKELNKDEFLYTIMIRQPEFVTKEVAQMALEKVMKKNPHPFLERVYFQTSEESLNIQMLHIGPYDDEPESFAKMDEFAQENNLLRIEKEHREIYLSDARKVAPEKLKTVLRYKVQPK